MWLTAFVAAVLCSSPTAPAQAAATGPTGPTAAAGSATANAFAIPRPLRPEDQTVAFQSREDAARLASPAAMESLKKNYGLSEARAREAIITQAVPVNLEAALRSVAGDDLVATRFDNEAGAWVISLLNAGSSSSSRSAVDGVLKTMDLLAYARFETVPWSKPQLTKELDHIAHGLPTDVSGKVLPALIGARLIVRLSDELTSAQIAEVKNAIPSGPIDYRVVNDQLMRPPPATTCAYPFCTDLVGGIYYGRAQVNGASCTSSFYVGYAGQYTPHFLTAATAVFSVS